MKPKTCVVTTTEGILALAKDAAFDSQAGQSRNRSACIDKLAAVLDPDGVHLLQMSMPHDHVAGRRVDSHLRTQWLIAVKPDVKPARRFKEGIPPAQDLWLDVSFDAYNKHTEKRTL